MTFLRQRREYVIERMPHTPTTVYGAFWPDHEGWRDFQSRLIVAGDTVQQVKEMIERHYPGAVLVYEPEDVKALVAEATEALKGDEG